MNLTRLRTRLLLAAPALSAVLLSGCESMNNTEKGAVGGGLLGAGAGALVGAALHRPAAGALIGGAAGAVTGAAVGNHVDRVEERQAAEAAALQSSRGPVSVQDVATMALNHISDDVIINQIRTSGTVFSLNPNDIYYLKQNGVSDGVIEEMQATRYRVPRRVYVADPYYAPVYYAPPPPVGVGIGVRIR